MPHLDVSTYTSQLFWLCVCFFSMLFIMSRFIVPKIAEIIEQRRHRIDSYLDKTSLLKQQAEQILDNYHNKIKEANEKADKYFEDAAIEMNTLITKRQEELSEELNKKINQAEKKIENTKKKTQIDMQIMAENLAEDILKRINIQNINKKDVKQFVAANLKQD